jgi:hypothetical protein
LGQQLNGAVNLLLGQEQAVNAREREGEFIQGELLWHDSQPSA